VAAKQSWAVLPVKPFTEAKSRLDPVLSAAERHELARSLLMRELDVLQACVAVDRILVVSTDDLALEIAASHGAATLLEAGAGLNGALSQAREYAVAEGAESLLVLACDLPLVTTSDIDALFTAGRASVVIAPDRRRQGTNALLLCPPGVIDFVFGDDSFARHLALARDAGQAAVEISLPGLAFDVDTPEDWRDLLAVGWKMGSANGAREKKPAPPGAAAPGSREPTLPGQHRSA
jgi:2-phospho-L-lactate guanylyltransferase